MITDKIILLMSYFWVMLIIGAITLYVVKYIADNKTKQAREIKLLNAKKDRLERLNELHRQKIEKLEKQRNYRYKRTSNRKYGIDVNIEGQRVSMQRIFTYPPFVIEGKIESNRLAQVGYEKGLNYERLVTAINKGFPGLIMNIDTYKLFVEFSNSLLEDLKTEVELNE